MAATAQALGKIGDASAVGSLAMALREPMKSFLEDGDNPESVMFEQAAKVRRAAAGALARIGTPEARAALEQAASGGGHGERTAAREALESPAADMSTSM